MASTKLPAETTIGDVVSSLDDPIAYVRGVLENMTACRRKHGSATVSIGLMGTGKAPHYRVAPQNFILDVVEGKDLSAYFVAHHGRSHQEMTDWGSDELRVTHWSRGSMTYEQVQGLLGELRGFKRKKA
jgi:hypothetical protein